MENTSILSKRRSLTLSSRLLQKRHSASPQSRVCASAAQEIAKDVDATASPTVSIVDSIESTPPSKKMHTLDDSLDFSPRNSLSPTCLFSQTLLIGSPEVSWRWNCDNKVRGDKVNTTSDSGFDSEEFGHNACRQKDRRKQVREDVINEHRRKQFDNRQWRAQQIRDHELLKERCDKLHKQLVQQIAASEVAASETAAPEASSLEAGVTIKVLDSPSADPTLTDFLNDSDTDCFLLEASQQLESKIVSQHALKRAPVDATPTSHHKEKQSSFYMKFLEDESETEDWFLALDEVMLEATKPKKPRTSLQRYKSMPTKTAADDNVGNNVSSGVNCSTSSSTAAGMGKSETPRIKRHFSSHALSPSAASVRGQLFGRRK